MAEQYSQKYTIVCFFKPQEKYTNFSSADWPLHVTILDTFKTEWPLDRLCKALEQVAANIAPFTTTPIRKAMLGENKDVPVKLLDLEGDLPELHYKLMDLIDEGGFVFNTPEFVGDGFLPHATDQKNDQVEIGRPYPLVSISLVDMFPDSDHTRREIVNTFMFETRHNRRRRPNFGAIARVMALQA